MSTVDLVARVETLLAMPPDAWPTRDRILRESSRLIAAKGYHGASTRDITNAVGIRQPSLFNHFSSKLEILSELFRFELTVPREEAERIADSDGPAADRLRRYLTWDFRWYWRMPLDLRGMHEELLDELGLDEYRRDLERWTSAITAIVRDGVASGEFRDIDPVIVTSSMTALSWEMTHAAHRLPAQIEPGRFGAAAVDFVLAGLGVAGS